MIDMTEVQKIFVGMTVEDAVGYVDTVGQVPPVLWGLDHFTTLMLIETHVVDGNGNLEDYPFYRRMRVDGFEYPTKLNNDTEVEGHDDFDCLNDFILSGLTFITDGSSDSVQLTDLGYAVAAGIRKQKGQGNPIKDFDVMAILRPPSTHVKKVDKTGVVQHLSKYKGRGFVLIDLLALPDTIIDSTYGVASTHTAIIRLTDNDEIVRVLDGYLKYDSQD